MHHSGSPIAQHSLARWQGQEPVGVADRTALARKRQGARSQTRCRELSVPHPRTARRRSCSGMPHQHTCPAERKLTQGSQVAPMNVRAGKWQRLNIAAAPCSCCTAATAWRCPADSDSIVGVLHRGAQGRPHLLVNDGAAAVAAVDGGVGLHRQQAHAAVRVWGDEGRAECRQALVS